jgi:hypothetical protein
MYKRSSLNKLSVLHLLGLYSGILDELCDRRIIRTVNNPAADYAEHIVAKTLSLTPANNSTKGYDATDNKGKKYEIKSRRITHRNKPARFSAIRKLEEDHFDFLVAVLFEEDFLINKGVILPKSYVTKKAFWQAHVNAWILPINEELWNSEGAIDITDKLRKAQKDMEF